MTANDLQNEQVLQAYRDIAQEVMAFIGGQPWDEAGAKYEIFGKMISSEWWRKIGSELDQIGTDIPNDISKQAKASIYALRKHLLKLTGDRIWGLTFTQEQMQWLQSLFSAMKNDIQGHDTKNLSALGYFLTEMWSDFRT